MIKRALLAAGLTFATLAPAWSANCRQALALALDVSGSVDAREYRLQLDGVAAALSDEKVRRALLSQPGAPVHLLIFEWSGPDDQALLVPWTAITDGSALLTVTETLRQTRRRATTPGTAIGAAMTLGVQFLDQREHCLTRTLDVSGDGKSNLGVRPRTVKQGLHGKVVTINGLVIGAGGPANNDQGPQETSALSSYFQSEVIVGPGAFVITAIGFEDYAEAMTAKLLRELDGVVLSQLGALYPTENQ